MQIRSDQFIEKMLIKCRRSREEGKHSRSAVGTTFWREAIGGGASRRPVEGRGSTHARRQRSVS
jgi:hypothetical protein